MNEEIKRLIEDAARRLNVNVERMSVTAGTAGGVVWWEAQVRATGRIAGSVTPRIEAWSSGETIEQALDSLSLSFEPIGRAR